MPIVCKQHITQYTNTKIKGEIKMENKTAFTIAQDKKKIYSLYVASYINLKTSLLPELVYDGTTIIMLFPRVAGVEMAITEYNANTVNVNLRDYLGAYKAIKELVFQAKDRAKAKEFEE